jgi:methyl coenzyme M reductase beta subunit
MRRGNSLAQHFKLDTFSASFNLKSGIMMKLNLAMPTAICLVVFSNSVFAGCGPHKSAPSNHVVDVKFENNTAGPVNVTWYTFSGGTKMYQTLAAGQSYMQSTYTKHVWALTDASGKCLSTLVVKNGQTFKVH